MPKVVASDLDPAARPVGRSAYLTTGSHASREEQRRKDRRPEKRLRQQPSRWDPGEAGSGRASRRPRTTEASVLFDTQCSQRPEDAHRQSCSPRDLEGLGRGSSGCGGPTGGTGSSRMAGEWPGRPAGVRRAGALLPRPKALPASHTLSCLQSSPRWEQVLLPTPSPSTPQMRRQGLRGVRDFQS